MKNERRVESAEKSNLSTMDVNWDLTSKSLRFCNSSAPEQEKKQTLGNSSASLPLLHGLHLIFDLNMILNGKNLVEWCEYE